MGEMQRARSGAAATLAGVAATGTFSLSITEATEVGAGGVGGAAGGDPCDGGATMAEEAAVISFTPDGNYQDDADCHWTVSCAAGGVVTIVFEQLETEAEERVRQRDQGAPARQQRDDARLEAKGRARSTRCLVKSVWTRCTV